MGHRTRLKNKCVVVWKAYPQGWEVNIDIFFNFSPICQLILFKTYIKRKHKLFCITTDNIINICLEFIFLHMKINYFSLNMVIKLCLPHPINLMKLILNVIKKLLTQNTCLTKKTLITKIAQIMLLGSKLIPPQGGGG